MWWWEGVVVRKWEGVVVRVGGCSGEEVGGCSGKHMWHIVTCKTQGQYLDFGLFARFNDSLCPFHINLVEQLPIR